MSIESLWQICHKKGFDNAMLTAIIAVILRESNLTSKQVALDIGISTERVRNWYYRNTGMAALDLLKMLYRYDLVECLPFFLKNHGGGYGKPQTRPPQTEFTARLAMGVDSLSCNEKGVLVPRFSRIEQVAVALECSVTDLMRGFRRIPSGRIQGG